MAVEIAQLRARLEAAEAAVHAEAAAKVEAVQRAELAESAARSMEASYDIVNEALEDAKRREAALQERALTCTCTPCTCTPCTCTPCTCTCTPCTCTCTRHVQVRTNVCMYVCMRRRCRSEHSPAHRTRVPHGM